MKYYKVIDPKGVLIDGNTIEKGATLPQSATSSQVRAFLRFKQIEETDAPKQEEPETDAPKQEEPETDAPTIEEIKAALKENGVEFAPNTGEKKLRELFDKLGTE